MSILSGVSTSIPIYSGSGQVVPFPSVQGGSIGVGSQNGASAVTLSQSTGLGLSAFVGIFVDILAVVVMLSLVGVLVIVVVANRADPDPRGRRPQSVYCFVVSFVTLAIAVIGSAVVVTGVDVLVGNHSNAVSNAAARAILVGGLATVVSLVLLITHLRRGLDLARTDAITGPVPACRPELRRLSGLRVRLVVSCPVRILGVPRLRPRRTRAVRVLWRPVRRGSCSCRRRLPLAGGRRYLGNASKAGDSGAGSHRRRA